MPKHSQPKELEVKLSSSTEAATFTGVPEGSQRVETPGTGDCLFWSVMLSALIRFKREGTGFAELVSCLFGERGDAACARQLESDLLPAYQGRVTDIKNLDSGDALYGLMRQFRRRVAETVRGGTQYHASITGDVDDYCDRMLRPGEWGGETEIAAMATLLQVDMVVCRAGELPRRYQANPAMLAPSARVLHIAHVSASGQDAKASARNHYVYFVRARDCYWREPQSSSPDTSAKSSGQPASQEPPHLALAGTAPAQPPVAPTPQAPAQVGALESKESKHAPGPSVTPTTSSVPADSALAQLQASSGLPASTLTDPIFLALDHGRLWSLYYEVVKSWTDRYHSASTPLWALCLVAGDWARFQAASEGLAPRALVHHGITPLHYAAFSGDVALINQVMRFYSESLPQGINSGCGQRCTPLHLAAAAGQGEAARALLDAKANPRLQDKTGKTALLWAARGGLVDLMRDLQAPPHSLSLEEKATNGDSAIHEAAYGGQVAAIGYLLGQGVSVNARNNDDYTPLHWAAQKGQAEAARALLAAKADPRLKDKGGATALLRAAEGGLVDLMRDLQGAC